MEVTMQTIEGRLDEASAQLALQQVEWEKVRAAAAHLGEAPLRVPVGYLAALDAVVRRAQTITGAVAA